MRRRRTGLSFIAVLVIALLSILAGCGDDGEDNQPPANHDAGDGSNDMSDVATASGYQAKIFRCSASGLSASIDTVEGVTAFETACDVTVGWNDIDWKTEHVLVSGVLSPKCTHEPAEGDIALDEGDSVNAHLSFRGGCGCDVGTFHRLLVRAPLNERRAPTITEDPTPPLCSGPDSGPGPSVYFQRCESEPTNLIVETEAEYNALLEACGDDAALPDFTPGAKNLLVHYENTVHCSVFRGKDGGWHNVHGSPTPTGLIYYVYSDERFCDCEGFESAVFVAPVSAGLTDDGLTFEVRQDERSNSCE